MILQRDPASTWGNPERCYLWIDALRAKIEDAIPNSATCAEYLDHMARVGVALSLADGRSFHASLNIGVGADSDVVASQFLDGFTEAIKKNDQAAA